MSGDSEFLSAKKASTGRASGASSRRPFAFEKDATQLQCPDRPDELGGRGFSAECIDRRDPVQPLRLSDDQLDKLIVDTTDADD
jgi:hypothetical protein